MKTITIKARYTVPKGYEDYGKIHTALSKATIYESLSEIQDKDKKAMLQLLNRSVITQAQNNARIKLMIANGHHAPQRSPEAKERSRKARQAGKVILQWLSEGKLPAEAVEALKSAGVDLA